MNINPYGLEIKSNHVMVAPRMFGTLIQLTSEYRISWKHQIVQETGLTTSYTSSEFCRWSSTEDLKQQESSSKKFLNQNNPLNKILK